MPTWSIDTGAGSLIDPTRNVPVPAITGVKPAGPVFDKGDPHELTERLHAARKREGAARDGLVVGTDERSASFGVVVEARKLIEGEKYLEALRLIAPLIRTSPNDSQLLQVRLDIREGMEEDVLGFVAEKQARGDYVAPLGRLNELLGLDPKVGTYHCARVQTLLIAGRLDEARAAAERAGEYCFGEERVTLRHLQDEVMRRMLDAALEPARQHYRAGKYRKARKAMEETRARWSHERLWQVFHTYLEELGGNLFWSGRRPQEVKPAGEFAVVDRLHFLLVREELALGKGLLQAGHSSQAGPFLRAAFALAPHFPYLNYLLASVAYDSVEQALENGTLDLDTAQDTLAAARSLARIGATDSEIDGAHALLESIDAFDRAIDEWRKTLEAQKRELEALFEPLARKFRAFMEGAEDIDSAEKFRGLQKILRELRQAIPGARRKAKDEVVLQFLEQLHNAVERNWTQLEKLEPEVRIAEQLIAFRGRLTDILDPESDKLTSSGLPAIGQRLARLREELNGVRGSATSDAARKACDELMDELHDADLIAPVAAAFLDNIRSLQHPSAVFGLREQIIRVRTSGNTARGKMKTKGAKQHIDQLLEANAQFLRQLGG